MQDLADQEYIRQRLEPKPGDPHYLALSDILLAIRSLTSRNVDRILDYGSGGSPYRSLFGDCVYHRADLSGQGLDFQYGPDARLPNSVGGYDFVLSTQVLEHVENPVTYLRECHRVLKTNGRLLLTTHGLFEDHGCPYDFWRWTIFGLQKMVEDAGFRIEARKKVTTGPRAALFLSERQFDRLQAYPVGIYAKLLASGIRAVQTIGARRLHVAGDKTFSGYRLVDASVAGHDMYIGVAILATRV